MSAARLLCCIALAVTLCTVSALTPPTNHNPFLLLSNSTDSLAATSAGDTAWLLTSGALVSLMTPGLAFFYGGLVESTTVLNTLMMSYVCAAIVTIQFLVFGYSLAFSGTSAYFGDGNHVAMQNLNQGINLSPNPNIPHPAFIFFELQFATLTPALISGALIGRLRFRTWVLFVFLWSTIVYDPVAYWVWSTHGWLQTLGVLDFAGGTVVHISAGFSALIASLVVGERTSSGQQTRAHNVPFVLLGAALLNFGWFGFSGGSAFSSGSDSMASLACFNTAIGSSAGFLTWSLMEFAYQNKFSAIGAAMGIVSGLVAVTPACGYVSPMSAVAVSAIGTIAAFFGVRFKALLSADDALDVFACHGVGGFAGTVLTGCFASIEQNKHGNDGLFFGNAQLLGVQLVAAVVVALLASTVTFLILHLLKRIPYIGLRPTPEEESSGLDLLDHGSTAYMLMAAAGELQRRLRSQGIDPRTLEHSLHADEHAELTLPLQNNAVDDHVEIELQAAGKLESGAIDRVGNSLVSTTDQPVSTVASLETRLSLNESGSTASVASQAVAPISSTISVSSVPAASPSPSLSATSKSSSNQISSGPGSSRRVSEMDLNRFALPTQVAASARVPAASMFRSSQEPVRRHSEQDLRRNYSRPRHSALADMEEMMILAAQFDLPPGTVQPTGRPNDSAKLFAQQIDSIMARAKLQYPDASSGTSSRSVSNHDGFQDSAIGLGRSHSNNNILNMQFQQLQRLQQMQTKPTLDSKPSQM